MSTAPPPAFCAVNLSHKYPDDTVALAGLTADIPAGAAVAVLGPSGCGKSTLLSLLGLLWDGHGPSGSLAFHDGHPDHEPHNLLALQPDAQAALRAVAFGFVLQSSYPLPSFTCLENVAMPLAIHGWPTSVRTRWAEALIAATGSTDLVANAGKRPRLVSAGQRQRYAVLRAVIADPTVVFADEPSSNLDPGNTAAMFDLLARWRAGSLFDAARAKFVDDRRTPVAVRRWLAATRPSRTLVVVCHDIRTAYQRADRFLLINGGHSLEKDFPKVKWDEHAGLVERVLGLPAGFATADRLADGPPGASQGASE